jgi:hypothetical protein
MTDKSSVSETSLVSHDSVRIAVQAALRAAQVEGWTDAKLEQLSGVSARTIKSYRVDALSRPLLRAPSSWLL